MLTKLAELMTSLKNSGNDDRQSLVDDTKKQFHLVRHHAASPKDWAQVHIIATHLVALLEAANMSDEDVTAQVNISKALVR